ncbi:MAG: hypothetical protein PHN31_02530 [Candidatus Gracilibacteria bacterium]|nr:hypothetical protein [Candidatus Gracilibacteria bacterium]
MTSNLDKRLSYLRNVVSNNLYFDYVIGGKVKENILDKVQTIIDKRDYITTKEEFINYYLDIELKRLRDYANHWIDMKQMGYDETILSEINYLVIAGINPKEFKG